MPWQVVGQVTSLVSLLALVVAGIVEVARRRMLRQERMLKLLPEDERGQQLDAILDRFSVKTTDLARNQRFTLAQELLKQRIERFRLLAIGASLFVVVAGGIAAYTYSLPSVYRVRLIVVAPDGMPAADGTVVRGPGEITGAGGAWELVIPASVLSADRKVEIYASSRDSLFAGTIQVVLGSDHFPSVKLALAKREASLRGSVIDDSGNQVSGARVTIAGYADQSMTSATGHFELPAHAAAGESVQVHAEKAGYQPIDQWHPVGVAPVTLELKKVK